MKQFILTLLVAVGFSGTMFANTADLFTFNEEAIEAEFVEINHVESFVASNNGITFNQMEQTGALSNFNLNWTAYDASAAPMFGLSDMDWNSFLCGFCCWPVGIFTIILNDDKDSDQKTSYVVGVIVSVVLGAISGGGYSATI